MSPEKKDHDLTPVPSQTEQVGQIYESQDYSHDAVFGEITEDGPNYRSVRVSVYSANSILTGL